MSPSVKTTPEGYHTLTAYLYFKDAAKAIDFYKDVFGATERMRLAGPDGTVGHAEIELGDSVFMLADMPDRSPLALQGSACSFMVYVPDTERAFARAVDAGATVVHPIENKFYGDRVGTVKDPFGHEWSIATHIEDVPADEMEKRAAAAMAQMAGAS